MLISIYSLIIGFPIPIIFALLLNEIKDGPFKRVTQTISYLPHFISVVVVVGLLFNFLSPIDGVVNVLLKSMGKDAINFMSEPGWFRTLYIGSNIWQNFGWDSIIYLAALSSVDPQLYEAAQIDGATRLQRIFYITLPCIKSTIVVVLIMTMGNLFGGGLSGSNFEQCYLLGNNVNADTSTIIQTYVFDVGLAQGRYAYATAVRLIQSVISLVLIFASNFVSKKLAGSGLF